MSTSPHFKPETDALMLIDHQVGTLQLIKTTTPDTAIRNAVLLGRSALAYDMPIVMTSGQEDSIQVPRHPPLQQASPETCAGRVKRAGFVNAWTDPSCRRSRRPADAS
jgi:nicotinamidase-related amidase